MFLIALNRGRSHLNAVREHWPETASAGDDFRNIRKADMSNQMVVHPRPHLCDLPSASNGSKVEAKERYVGSGIQWSGTHQTPKKQAKLQLFFAHDGINAVFLAAYAMIRL